MKNILKSVFFTLILTLFGCEAFDLNQLKSPNIIQSETPFEPEFIFNEVQLLLPAFVNSANNITMQLTRQFAMTGGRTYENAFTTTSSNAVWRDGYAVLQNIKLMEPRANEKDAKFLLAISGIIKSYVNMTLTDLFGDMPYSEALQGSANLNPKFDSSRDIYLGCLAELDKSIEILNLTTTDSQKNIDKDFYYSKNKSKWITLAKTLKLKLYNNARLAGTDLNINIASKINELISQNDLIDTADEDFAFQYNEERNNPNSRHPLYNSSYETGRNAPYISNYMFWVMGVEKSVTDPRLPLYFHIQDNTINSDDSPILPCRLQSEPDHYNSLEYASFYNPSIQAPFCTVTIGSNKYWGRDHGNAEGRPQDQSNVTVVGFYPAGGKIGSPGSVQGSGTAGAKGAGIMPIILSSYVSFIKAEAILTLTGVSGNPLIELEDGIRKSIIKSSSFIPLGSDSSYTLNSVAVENYVNFVKNQYNSSANSNKKLEIIMKEFFIASWGNGIETYNNYRRTGYPSNFQPTLEPISGPYNNILLYPDASIGTNSNAPTENSRTRKLFWHKSNTILH